MTAEIDIDALKIFTKSRTNEAINIGKKLKTDNLNSRFTGSKKEMYFDLLTFEKFWNLKT